MPDKRIIDYNQAESLSSDDYLIIDGIENGTRKIDPNKLVKETDKTLSVEDSPADAKAVGDQLNDVKADLSVKSIVYAYSIKNIILPAPDGEYKLDGTATPPRKIGNVLDVNVTYQSDIHKLNLTGATLIDRVTTSSKYNKFPEAYVDSIDGFKLNRLYKIHIDVLEGTYTLSNPLAKFAYLLITNRDGSLATQTLPNGSVFYTTGMPQCILIGLRAGTYHCKLGVRIIDITDETVTAVDITNNLFQVYDKIAGVGDSLMCGYDAHPSPIIDSATAKVRGANWLSYFGADIGREITNLAVGGTSWHDWRYGANGADISSANIDINAYIVGLGVNDSRQGLNIGSSDDIAAEKADNSDSVYGNIDYVVRTLHEYNTNSHIFLLTIPGDETNRVDINNAIRYVCGLYVYAHCIDLDALYGNEYRYGIFNKTFKSGHSNPVGYRISANYVKSAINSYMISNFVEFANVPYQL